MADTIVITKKSNGKVGVLTSSMEYSLSPSFSPYRNLGSDVVQILDTSGNVVDSFLDSDVEKVVRLDGTEVTIGDGNAALLFTELDDNFFFQVVDGVTLTNSTAGTIVAGTVVSVGTSDFSFTTTTVAGSQRAIGFLDKDTAAGGEGLVLCAKKIKVLATGAVTRGNFVAVTTTDGQVTDTGTSGSADDLGIALESIGGAGLVTITGIKAEIF